GQHLEPARTPHVGDSLERSELRRQRLPRLAIDRPRDALVAPGDVAPDAKSEGVRVARAKAQLAEWHTELGGPPKRVDARRGIPHAVPRKNFELVGITL